MGPFGVAAWLLLAGAGQAGDLGVDAADTPSLLRLMERGPILLLQKDASGQAEWVTGGIIIHAPIQAVWDVISNLDGYETFMPHTEDVRVLTREGDEELVHYKMRIKFSILSVGVQMTHRVVFDRERGVLSWNQVRGDMPGARGAWVLIPAQEAGLTLAFYRVYGDLRSLGFGPRMILRAQPELELGVYSALAIESVEAARDRIEHPEKYAPEGARAFQ
ncbi:MAG: hypothetical protein HYY13_10185 [Nitrospirae bacterium]|nr:hypothetical protein [Nitrospirota bacterium]